MTKLFKFPSRETVDPMIDEDLDYLESIIEWKKLMVMALQQQIELYEQNIVNNTDDYSYQIFMMGLIAKNQEVLNIFKGGIGTDE